MDEIRPHTWMATRNFSPVDCIYRYWRAKDNSRYLRPYSFKSRITLECRRLDDWEMVIPRSEVVFTEIDIMLDSVFRNKILVSEDDPLLNQFKLMSDNELCKISVLPAVGSEKIAVGIYNHIRVILVNQGLINRVDVRTVEIDDGDLTITYMS